ncbi:MAG: hypothetical protein MUF25_05590, partial [Pirellulaceae bacterium]|nr:hypothetical protein [Pirellulaceae bacterium]
GNYLNESNELNNANYDRTSMLVNLVPPADLVVGTITVPANASPGFNATISYTVHNDGDDAARGSWYDSLYISADGAWDINDAFFGRVYHQGDVPGHSSYSHSLTAPLPGVLPGDYHVIIRSDIRNQIPESDETNNLGASLDRVEIDAQLLELGQPQTGNLAQGRAVYYKTEVLTAGETVRLRFDGDEEAFSELYVRYGSMPSRNQYDRAAIQPFVSDQEIVLPVEQTGVYYVMAYATGAAGAPQYTIRADVIPFSILSVQADRVGNTGNATVKVSGARFRQDTEFYFLDSQLNALPAEGVYLQDTATAFVTFDLFQVPPAVYTVGAYDPGQDTLVLLEDALTVVAGTGYNIDTLGTGPAVVAPNRNYRFDVHFGNNGDGDAMVPLLLATGITNTPLGFSPGELYTGAPLQILGTPEEGPLNILRPGSLNSVSIYYRSGTAAQGVNVRIESITHDDANVITETEWEKIKLSVKPAGVSSESWNAFWTNIPSRIGTTWGQYVRFLNRLVTDLSVPGEPLRDVRAMFQTIYDQNPDYRPTSTFQGSVHLADSGASVANADVAAYLLDGGVQSLEGIAKTDANGNFTFSLLPAGTYALAIDNALYVFDQDRDGEYDQGSPEFDVLEEADTSGAMFFVVPLNLETASQESQPSLAVDGTGQAHLVWSDNGQIWHAIHGGSGWEKAQAISNAVGKSPKLVWNPNLLGSGAAGLMVVWQAGEGNESELFYSLGRVNSLGTGYEWSVPEAMTSDAVQDGPFDAGATTAGAPVVLMQKQDIGGEDLQFQDDPDTYTWTGSLSPTFPTLALQIPEPLLREALQSDEFDALASKYRIRLQNIAIGPWQIPSWVPVLGGTYGLNVRGSAEVEVGTCKPSGSIIGEIQVKLGDNAEIFGRVSGGVGYKSVGTKNNCEYKFDAASISLVAGGAVDIPIGTFTVPIIGKINAGPRIEGSVGGTGKWKAGSPFPSWPPSESKGKFTIGGGVFFKGKANLWLIGEASVTVRVIGQGNFKWDAGGVGFDNPAWSASLLARAEWKVNIPLKGEYKKFIEFTYTYNPGGINTSGLENVFDTATIGAFLADLPDNMHVGLTPATGYGTLNDYSSAPVQIVAQNLDDDTRPTIVTGPGGQLYGLWSNTAGVNVFSYDASQASWGTAAVIPGTGALATQDAVMEFDGLGRGLVVWSGQDFSGLDENSTEEAVWDAMQEGGDLFYSIYDAAGGTFTAPQMLFALSGQDQDVTMTRTEDGKVIASWVHREHEQSATLYAAVWDPVTGAWAPAQAVTSGAIADRPALNLVAGLPTLIWTEQLETTTPDGQPSANPGSELRSATLGPSGWSAPQDFAYGLAGANISVAASPSGNAVQAWPDESGLVASFGDAAGTGWSTPQVLAAPGQAQPATVSTAFDGAGNALVLWGQTSSGSAAPDGLTFAVRSAEGGIWHATETLASYADGAITSTRLARLQSGVLVATWTVASGQQNRLFAAVWKPAEFGWTALRELDTQVLTDSVEIGEVAGDAVVMWAQTGGSGSPGAVERYATFSPSGWSAASNTLDLTGFAGASTSVPLVPSDAPGSTDHGNLSTQPCGSCCGASAFSSSRIVTLPTNAAPQSTSSFDAYALALESLLSARLDGQSAVILPSGIYLGPLGDLPFTPPEDCCKCDKIDTVYQGADQGCGFTVTYDQDNCKKIITYKPCVPPPVDPNDIVGPIGYGDENWIAADRQLDYMIRFENDPVFAQAPAQKVVVTQKLDSDLDYRSFRLRDFGFGGLVFQVPENRAFYSTRIDLVQERGYFVDVTAGINIATGEAVWTLVTIDPETGEQPLDPRIGFLVINNDAGDGEGFLSYSVRPRRTARTGDVVDAQARIVFDTEAPIDTPPIFNTLDAVKPQSVVQALPATANDVSFQVTWTGSDDAGGSGLAAFNVFVSDNDGPFVPWLLGTQLTEAQFLGAEGHRYAFYSVAFDNAGNEEGVPTAPDAATVTPGGTATIGDFVWADADGDGIQDDGESGMADVIVKLYYADGGADPLAETTTDADGGYSFPDLDIAQSYFLEFTAPAGYAFSPPGAGDDALDSDAALDTGRTEVFTVVSGLNSQWDAGLLELGSISGLVWRDSNGDEQQNDGEPVLPDQVVYLDSNQDGDKDDGEPERTTDANGRYMFENLRPGQYVVRHVVQQGWQQTHPGAGGATAFTYSGSDAALFTPGETQFPGVAPALLSSRLDIDGDGYWNPVDVLLIVNALNAEASDGGILARRQVNDPRDV